MNDGCEMQQAVEQLNTRKTYLMTECANVIAGKSIYVSRPCSKMVAISKYVINIVIFCMKYIGGKATYRT